MTINVDYMAIVYMVMGLFALVGFFRGWLKEGITTFFLGLLTIILTNPELAGVVFNFINGLVKLLWVVLEAKSLDVSALSAAADVVDPPRLDPENQQLYIIALIVLVAASYMTGRFTIADPLSPISRLVGGILGLFNGFLVISLVREYLMGFFLQPEPKLISAQDIPQQISIQITGMPQQSLLIGYFPMVMIGLIGVVVLIIMFQYITKLAACVFGSSRGKVQQG